jgi:hypothetical protein
VTSQSGHEPDRCLQRAADGRSNDAPGHGAVPRSLLTEFEDTEEAKRLQRMADREIVDRLRSVGFDRASSDWTEFAEALLEYGYAVLVAWAVTGEIAGKVAAHGGLSRGRVPEMLHLNEDEARGLAADLLMVSIERFRTRSLGRWSPAGGASLTTFFIGRCLLDFADVYWAWYRRERREPPLEPLMVDDGRHSQRPDDEAEARVLADQILGDSPGLRQVLQLQGDGYSLSEIARKLGTTEAGVRSQIYRGRQRLARSETSDE